MDPYYGLEASDPKKIARIQAETVRNLAARYTAMGYPISPEEVDVMVRTIRGEAVGEGVAGQEAVGNTMLNRMASGERPDRMLQAYDANGLDTSRTGPPNDVYTKTHAGSDGYTSGISALMRPQSPFSKFTNLMPDKIKAATHYYNPAAAQPKWGGPQFMKLGHHVFGNAPETSDKSVLDTRATSPIFADAGKISVDPSMLATASDNTLSPFDYVPKFQTPDTKGQSLGWNDYKTEADLGDQVKLAEGKPGFWSRDTARQALGDASEAYGKATKAATSYEPQMLSSGNLQPTGYNPVQRSAGRPRRRVTRGSYGTYA